MRDSKGLKGAGLSVFFSLLVSLAISSIAFADVTVTGITRISHPVYRIGNVWYGVRNPWNRDFTRILIYEKRDFTDPGTGKTGRGLVWGFINDLKSWTTLSEYEAAAKPLPNNSYWQVNSAYWSPIPGEENIIYGVYTSDESIRKLNVDTGEITWVAAIDPGDGTDVSLSRAMGFTTDNRLIVNFHLTDLYSGGYEVDVQTGQRTRYSKILEKCDAGSQSWPAPVWRSGHFTSSADGKWWMEDAGGNTFTLTDRNTCQTTYYSSMSIYPRTLSHFSWFNKDNWFVGDDRGVGGDYNHYPTVEPFRVYKINTDGSFSVLFEMKSAQYSYIDNNGNINDAYLARPLPTIRADGRQILFTSTDGKYLYEDYLRTGVTPWGTEGAFLADLSTDTADTTPPSIPGNLSAVAASGSQIDLSWTASTDNTGVTGYTVFRDGAQIATISGTGYSDTGLSAGTTYQYTVSAYDAAGNSSGLSGQVQATTLSADTGSGTTSGGGDTGSGTGTGSTGNTGSGTGAGTGGSGTGTTADGGNTQGSQLSAPVLLFPADGQSVSMPVTFTWQKSTNGNGGAIHYTLLCSKDSLFSAAQSYTIASYKAGEVSYAGIGMWTRGPLSIPACLFLSGVVLILGLRVSSRKRIRILSAVAILTLLLISCSGEKGVTGPDAGTSTDNMNYTVSGLDGSTTYYWKVVATDDSGGRTESETRQITTE